MEKSRRALLAAVALIIAFVAVPLVAAAVAPTGPGQPSAGGAASRSAMARADAPAGLVVGDSMTAHSVRQVRRELPGWEIDAVRGRQVADLIPVLREYKATHAAVPPVVVIALGSNERTWRRLLYQYAVDMLPARTTVVFQSLWRDPAVWPRRAARMGDLTRVMHRVADRRRHTCVSRWRARAAADHDTLVLDGVHPTRRGRAVFARVLGEAVRRCG